MSEGGEINQNNLFKDTIKRTAQEIRSVMSVMSEEKRTKSEHAISEVAKYIPESTLVGGWALRFHLQQLGQPIPDMPALDIDFIINQSNYDKVRETLKFSDEEYQLSDAPLSEERKQTIQKNLRRKGKQEPVPQEIGEGSRDFMKNPENYMALEDATYKQHIDLFVGEEEDVNEVVVNGIKVRLISPEMLFLRRFQQIEKQLEQLVDGKIKLPRKIYQYFFLNADIINDEKMDALQKKMNPEDDWQTKITELVNGLHKGLEDKSIELVDEYH